MKKSTSRIDTHPTTMKFSQDGTVLFVEIQQTRDELSFESQFYAAYWSKFGSIVGGQRYHQFSNYLMPEPPYWIMHLASGLRSEGIQYKRTLLKYSASLLTDRSHKTLEASFKKCLNGRCFDVIALSPLTVHYPVVRAFLKWVRKELPGTSVVLGGPHATFTDAECLRDGANIVARGEFDLHFAPLVQSMITGVNLCKLPGTSRLEDGVLIRTPLPAPINDLGQLPVPAFELFSDRAPNIPYIRLFTQRGCAGNCAFCANTIWKRSRHRPKPASLIEAELSSAFRTFGRLPVFVADETFTQNMGHARKVAHILRISGVPWFVQTRPDRCNEEILRFLSSNGCRLVSFGAESGNKRLLKRVSKGFSPEEVMAACKMAKRAGLGVLTYWLVGLPGETEETAKETQRMAIDLLLRGLTDLVEYFICVPYPGTDLHQRPSDYGLKIRTGEWHLYREDGLTCFRTNALSAQRIYSLWNDGMQKLASIMVGG